MFNLSFQHADKSMVDNPERSNDTPFSENRTGENAIGNKQVRMVDVPGTGPSYERLFHGTPENEAKERIKSTDGLDVVVLLSSLEKANETIRRLHHELHSSQDDIDDEEIPVVEIPEIKVTNAEPKSTPRTPDSAHRTVNVRMLDGENFVTDWDDLRSLPPPPDHGLKSPIVAAVLEQWTQDRSLHESLLAWIEQVMKGDNLEGLRPLTISSLDHQVRDGISMHVLPHLLRRADIHVAVQTRAHRQTTYDMSVTVSQKKEYMASSKSQPQASLLDSRDSLSEDEWANNYEPNLSSAESVAHSAVTEHIANLPSVSRTKASVINNDSWSHPPQTPTQTEYSNFPSRLRSRSGSADTYDESSQHFRNRQNEQQQSVGANGTIMGALGGALSGLLSRNKYAISPGRTHYASGSIDNSRDSSNMLPASLRAQMDLTSSPIPGSKGLHRIENIETAVSASIDDQYHHHQEEMEPYHRVVSAPPGRIGVTFVEFRGHAMVSDVAADSPLTGWVFPSDILIAVDDIPVSGMRVRDIVNILSTRKDRHRAMRVISSHAMNEFTMMSRGGGSLNEAIVGGD